MFYLSQNDVEKFYCLDCVCHGKVPALVGNDMHYCCSSDPCPLHPSKKLFNRPQYPKLNNEETLTLKYYPNFTITNDDKFHQGKLEILGSANPIKLYGNKAAKLWDIINNPHNYPAL